MNNLSEKNIGPAPLTESPDKKLLFVIKDGSVTNKKLAKDAVSTDKLQDGAVTPEKVSEGFETEYIYPYLKSFDTKYDAITNELYSMVNSLQVGGIALSGQLGSREDIGIHQKAITELLSKILEELSALSGKTYLDYTLSTNFTVDYSEAATNLIITANCENAFNDFDSIQIYVDDELLEESSDTEECVAIKKISNSCTVKTIGTIMGKSISKELSIIKEIPFFIGSGSAYTDIMDESHRIEMGETLEGDYEVTVSSNGDNIFIIIPISKKNEFNKAYMNGFEIPFNVTAYTNYVVYKSSNTYKPGTYPINISINS